jgi:hypothetical protein
MAEKLKEPNPKTSPRHKQLMKEVLCGVKPSTNCQVFKHDHCSFWNTFVVVIKVFARQRDLDLDMSIYDYRFRTKKY